MTKINNNYRKEWLNKYNKLMDDPYIKLTNCIICNKVLTIVKIKNETNIINHNPQKKYCSKICRNRALYLRHKDNVMEYNKSHKKQQIFHKKPRNILYFIKNIELNTIKIGVTNSLKHRFNNMMTDNSSKLIILGIIKNEDTFKIEYKLHDKFKKYRIRGEWFKECDEILEYIKKNTLGEDLSICKKNQICL